MAATPRGTMRANGRSPPFLAIGLFVALCILGFNYWSLSATNSEQSNEIAIIESELRLVNAKKSSAEKRAEAVSDKIKDLEADLLHQKSSLATKMSENADLNEEIKTLQETNKQVEENLRECLQGRSEADSSLAQCRGELTKLENKPSECDESTCSNYILASRQKTLDDIVKVLGLAALQPLRAANGDVGSYAAQVDQLPENAYQQLHVQPQLRIDNQPQAGGDVNQPQVVAADLPVGEANLPVGGANPEVGGAGDKPQVGVDNMQMGKQPAHEEQKSAGNDQSHDAAGQDALQIPSPDLNQPGQDDAHLSENRPNDADSPQAAEQDGEGADINNNEDKVPLSPGDGGQDVNDDDYDDDDDDGLPDDNDAHIPGDGQDDDYNYDGDEDEDGDEDYNDDHDGGGNVNAIDGVDDKERNLKEMANEDNTFEELKDKMDNNRL